MVWSNGILIITIFFAGLILIALNYFFKRISLKQIKKYQDVKNPSTAIILGDDSIKSNFGNLFVSTYLGIRFLIKYLNLKMENFKIFIEPSKLEFKHIVKNNSIKKIYLIGHGSKRGFSLNRKEDGLPYSEFKNNKNKKDEVHLYHCTHSRENPLSLIDYLVKKENRVNCFISNNKIPVINYVLLFQKLYKNEKKRIKNENK